jgi:predicted amidohydrolase
MKVALISMRPKIADKDSNIKKMHEFIKKKKADMYIFGEITLTGYRCKDELRDLAETIKGPSINKIKEIARQSNSYIVFGMPLEDEKIKGLIHNAGILIHPDGKVDVYEKWFLPTFGPFEEKLYFNGGEKLPVFNTKLGRIGIIICYDLYFPELCKAYSMQGADIIICISASPSSTRQYFERIFPARAIENTTFFIYANLTGTQEDLVFWGGSQAFDPLGNQIIKLPYFKEAIETFEIDLKILKTVRANRPVLRDFRPEIYQDLYSISRFKHVKKE